MQSGKHQDNLRVVLDTNVLISSLQYPNSAMADIWPALSEKRYQLIISPAIITEMAGKLRGKFQWEESRLQNSVRDVVRKTELVQPKVIPDAVPNDPDDNHIVACALEGRADLIVSGDRHLLTLVEYEGISIVRPVDFLRMVSGPKE